MPRREISVYSTVRIIALNEAGFSNHHLLVTLNIPTANVIGIIYRYEETGTVRRMLRSEHPRVSTEMEDRCLAQFSSLNLYLNNSPKIA